MLLSTLYLSYCLPVLQTGREAQCYSDLPETMDEETDERSIQETTLFAAHRHKVIHFTSKEILKSENNLSAKYWCKDKPPLLKKPE